MSMASSQQFVFNPSTKKKSHVSKEMVGMLWGSKKVMPHLLVRPHTFLPSRTLTNPFLHIVFSVVYSYYSQESDDLVRIAGTNLIDRAVEFAKERDLWHRYIYLNYADASQDVFAGYGEENRKRLWGIQKQWDPEGVWSKLQPGGFKI
jgi:hypothetical protein